MMKPLPLLFVILFIIPIFGCTTATDEKIELSQQSTPQNESTRIESTRIEPPKNEPPKNEPTKIDPLACKEKGGTIKKVCMLGKPFCIQNHNDAGKECTDASQCAGDCRLEKQFVDAGKKASGFCSVDNDPCGCFQAIEKGIAQPLLCID